MRRAQFCLGLASSFLLIALVVLSTSSQSAPRTRTTTAPYQAPRQPTVSQPRQPTFTQPRSVPTHVRRDADALRQKLIDQRVPSKDIDKTIDAYYRGMGVMPTRASPTAVPSFSPSFQPTARTATPSSVRSSVGTAPTSTLGQIPPATSGRLQFTPTSPSFTRTVPASTMAGTTPVTPTREALTPAASEIAHELGRGTIIDAASRGAGTLLESRAGTAANGATKAFGIFGFTLDLLWPQTVYAPTHGDSVLAPER